MPRLAHRPVSLSTYALAILLCIMAGAATPAEVAIVLSEKGGVYSEMADEMRSQLAAETKVSLHDTATLGSLAGSKPDFLVAVGAKAAQALAARPAPTPLLVTLLPRTAFEQLAAGRKRGDRPMSAVFLDQPFARQLNLIRLALPGAKRIGILLGADSHPHFHELNVAAMDRQLHIQALQVEKGQDIAWTLQRLLPDIDLLLALPEPAVFNAGTIQMILLSAYRQQIPMVGFSAAYTRAGAILSLHSTPQQIARQAGDMLRIALSSGRLPAPQPPREYQVSTNPHVARSLGLAIESEQRLLQRLQSLE